MSKSIEDRVINWISRHGNKGTAPRDIVASRITNSAVEAHKALCALRDRGAGTFTHNKFYLHDSMVRVGTNLNTQDPRFRSDLLRLLRKPTTVKALGTKLHVHHSDVEHALDDLEQSGYIVDRTGQRVTLGSVVPESARRIVRENHFIDKPVRFGVVADMHICSKSQRLDVLNAAYDEFAAQGIDTVFCPGNYVDGEFQHNRYELYAHGIADQCQYGIDNWPQRRGIRTYYIDGDCHEGWYLKREGIEFGRYFMLEARRQGREDLVYLGSMEADIELKAPNGSAVIKLMHPGGGSSYAISYSVQKIAESFQGGEKPAIAIVGHYHKFEYCVSTDSEILTRGGWRRPGELMVGSEVLGYNLGTGKLEWTILKHVYVTPPTAVNYYENTEFAINCTPDHKWVWEQDNKRFLATLGEVQAGWNGSRPLLMQSAKAPDGPGLGQLHYAELLDRDSAVQAALKMTSGERRAFVLGLLFGEGSKANSTISFSQNQGPVNDAFALAAFMEGWSLGRPRKCSNSECLRTAVYQTPYRDYCIRESLSKTSVEPAWCPTTGLGTWVMRQGGTITITGNSFPRSVHMLQPGCCQDQTRFMRKHKLAAHVGFCTVELQQDTGGSITRFAPTFYPFWDRGYYLSRDGQGAAARLQRGKRKPGK